MGEVYRARDTTLNREVAVKVLPDLFTADTNRIARFEREAQTLASLNHPHIAQIYGLERAGGARALMELVDGEDLAARIARGALTLDEALPIAQIAEAVEAAHEQGIIHRDLKPANIKVRPDGMVKVLDCGPREGLRGEGPPHDRIPGRPHELADDVYPWHGTALGLILGTAAYMAPEQARGVAVDRRVDYDDARIDAVDRETGECRTVLHGASLARYAPTGHLLYARGGILLAIAFDLKTLTTSGTAVPVLQAVGGDATTGAAHVTWAGDGTMAYVAGESTAGQRRLALALGTSGRADI